MWTGFDECFGKYRVKGGGVVRHSLPTSAHKMLSYATLEELGFGVGLLSLSDFLVSYFITLDKDSIKYPISLPHPLSPLDATSQGQFN